MTSREKQFALELLAAVLLLILGFIIGCWTIPEIIEHGARL